MALKLTNTVKSNISKVFWITIGWTAISVFYVFSVYASLIDLETDFSDINVSIYFEGGLLTGILAGTIGGTMMVLFWEKWLRTKNYGSGLLSILFSFSILYYVIGVLTALLVGSRELELPLNSELVWRPALTNFFGIPGIQSYLFWLSIVITTLIVLLVNDKYGPGVFRDFLLGKYFQPKREERIFMFMDLRSSTSIAEQLGEQRYFNFLKDTFKHVTKSILDSKGEIYQYVGDEIVVSWKTNEGVKHANCINCFLNVQNALVKRKAYYEETYDNIIPVFKAGLHYGHVMAGEIGVVKREIAFSGDVLNTASRIQEKCNELGVDVLLSNSLLKKLNLQMDRFSPKQMGEMELRGKQQKVMLFTV